MKNHGYNENYDMVMNLAQGMLAGPRSKKQNIQGEGAGSIHSATNL
jgi:hypothetical protein